MKAMRRVKTGPTDRVARVRPVADSTAWGVDLRDSLMADRLRANRQSWFVYAVRAVYGGGSLGAGFSQVRNLRYGRPGSLRYVAETFPGGWTGLRRSAALGLLVLLVTGCQGPRFNDALLLPITREAPLVLHEGDQISVQFPGAADLNTATQIRRDGMVTLPVIGEFKAAGKTPADIEKELLKLYEPELQTKELSVTVVSAAFPVYVTGAVLRPGKIISDRPLSALEAIMEAGGFDYAKANLKGVTIIRSRDDGVEHYRYYTLDFRKVLSGAHRERFDLKPSDIIFVPERFTWF